MNTTLRKSIAVVAAGTIALSLLAGCSSKDGDGKESTAPAPSAPSSKSAAPSPTITMPPLPKEPGFKGTPAGAVMDVKVVQCPTAAGTQVAKVEVTNSTKSARDYAIMVIWLQDGSGTPVGSGLATAKKAAPGKKVSLEVKGKVVVKADKCVLNVKAGTLK